MLRGESWPVYALVLAALLNFLQVVVSPSQAILNAGLIESALDQGLRSFSQTRLGDCKAQLAYLASNYANSDLVVLGGINPVFWVEMLLLCITFGIVFLVWGKSRSLRQEKPELFSVGWSLTVGLVLLVVDQIRYSRTSIFKEDKNFYTWSSYCLQGDAAWLVDIAAYLPVYFSLGAAITIYCRIASRVKPENAELSHNQIGLGREHYFLSGTMLTVTWISGLFFLFWLVGTKIGPTSSFFYAAQAAVIFGLIFGLILFSGSKAIRLNSWYHKQFEAARIQVASQRGIQPEQVTDKDVQDKAAVQENPFDAMIGVHGKSFVTSLTSLAGPIMFYLGHTVPALSPFVELFGELVG